MKIDILCPSSDHPVNSWLVNWISAISEEHNVRLLRDKSELDKGDVLFLVSCTQLISASERLNYRETLVLHASDLPEGRGWSPHVWAILNGAEEITVSLLSAEDHVDSGAIWAQKRFRVSPDLLFDEIGELLFRAEIDLMSEGVEMVLQNRHPTPQPDKPATYYPRRTPEDSRLDPNKTLCELFNQIRVADPKRYPAFFELHGSTYILTLRKVTDDENSRN